MDNTAAVLAELDRQFERGSDEDRPGTSCCLHDARMWTDFDNIVRNQAWMEAHLANRDRYLERVTASVDVPDEFTSTTESRYAAVRT